MDGVIPGTPDRVSDVTSDDVNSEIQHETDRRVTQLSMGSVTEINRRLEELDSEWDIERTLEANAATLVLTGCLLGGRLQIADSLYCRRL